MAIHLQSPLLKTPANQDLRDGYHLFSRRLFQECNHVCAILGLFTAGKNHLGLWDKILADSYVQNDPAIGRYGAAIRAGQFATLRGIRLKTDDHLRRAVIEALMWTGEVDLDVVRQDYGMLGASFDRELASLLPLARDGIVELEGLRIRITEAGRPFLRAAASHFDRYLDAGAARHSQAV